jgi:hypothetical protein
MENQPSNGKAILNSGIYHGKQNSSAIISCYTPKGHENIFAISEKIWYSIVECQNGRSFVLDKKENVGIK